MQICYFVFILQYVAWELTFNHYNNNNNCYGKLVFWLFFLVLPASKTNHTQYILTVWSAVMFCCLLLSDRTVKLNV